MIQLSGRQPSRISRRDELLAVAARLFAGRGFAGVTMDDIGAAAGISGPALYHHFTGKEAMLGEMLTGVSEHLLAGGRRVVERHRHPAEALGWLIHDQAEFAVDHPELITVHARDLVHASADDQRAIRRLQAQYVEVWVDVVLRCATDAARSATGPADRPAPPMDRATAGAAVHAAIGLINSTPHSARLGRVAMVALLRRMAGGALAVVVDGAG